MKDSKLYAVDDKGEYEFPGSAETALLKLQAKHVMANAQGVHIDADEVNRDMVAMAVALEQVAPEGE